MIVVSEAQRVCEPELWEGLKKKTLPPHLKRKAENQNLEFMQLHGLEIIISVRRPKMAHLRQAKNSDTPSQSTHFLPTNHLLYVPPASLTAKQIIEFAHSATRHGSLPAMQAYLYQLFWIPRPTKLIKQVWRNCTNSQLIDIKVHSLEEAGLHSYCSEPTQRTFEVIGINFSGPYDVMKPKPTPKPTPQNPEPEPFPKEPPPCVLIIVDPNTRAVSLQPCRNQKTESVQRALQLFQYQKHAKPDLIVSNNAKEFLAERDLFKVIDSLFPTNWQNTVLGGVDGMKI